MSPLSRPPNRPQPKASTGSLSKRQAKRAEARGSRPKTSRARRRRNAFGNRTAGPAPSSSSFPGGSSHNNKRPYVLENDEFIENVNSSIEFRVRTLSVNPGQASVFPWLSSMARNFEKYKFDYLEFYFRPRVSGFAAAGQRGQVVMSFDFDAADAPPTSKQQMEATWPHSDDMPYKEIRLSLPPSELTPPGGKYVRPGLPPVNTDIKTYDAGLLHVSTSGMDSLDSYIGELRVRYKAILTVPILENVETFVPARNIAVAYGNSDAVPSGGPPYKLNMGNSYIGPNPLGVTNGPATDQGTGLLLPPGQYWIDVTVRIGNAGTINDFVVEPVYPGSWSTDDYSDPEMVLQSAGVTTAILTGRFFFTSRGPVDSHYTNIFQLSVTSTTDNPADILVVSSITAL